MYAVYTSRMAAGQPRADYHHGDLRQACIEHGLALLVAEGKDAVSLREVARRCRVSPRAPYRHFKDKTAFLAAIAETGFGEFGAGLAAARRRYRNRPAQARLLGLARAYLDFALRRPALMQLMFGEDFPQRRRRFPALDHAALATFAILQEEMALVAPAAGARAHRLHAATAWALVHGLAELLRHGQLAHVLPRPGERRALTPWAVALFTSFN